MGRRRRLPSSAGSAYGLVRLLGILVRHPTTEKLKIGSCPVESDWALVTGASCGIGLEFCHQLAASGMNLVMVARRKDKLAELASQVMTRYQIQTVVLGEDLSEPRAAQRIQSKVKEQNIRIRLLVNNAAVGFWGRFEGLAAESYERMVQLNTITMVLLCREFFADLSSHRTSAIINVSSQAAIQPMPYMAVYAATKAFVHSFSRALYEEWKAQGVLVQTLVPGPTATEFDEKAGGQVTSIKSRRGTTHQVVTTSLAHLSRDLPVVASIRGTYWQRVLVNIFPSKKVVHEVGKRFQPQSDLVKKVK